MSGRLDWDRVARDDRAARGGTERVTRTYRRAPVWMTDQQRRVLYEFGLSPIGRLSNISLTGTTARRLIAALRVLGVTEGQIEDAWRMTDDSARRASLRRLDRRLRANLADAEERLRQTVRDRHELGLAFRFFNHCVQELTDGIGHAMNR